MVLPGIVTNVTAFGAFVDIGISCPSTHPIVPSLREIRAGGMATVYLTDDLTRERKVALKVLKPELAAVVGAEV